MAEALDGWAYAHGVELIICRRGKPVDNCYVESFHDKFRDECLLTRRHPSMSRLAKNQGVLFVAPD